MRLVVQRCSESSVSIDGKVVGKIGMGVMVLVGFTKGDSEKEIDYLINKLIHLRIFDDEDGVMNRSLLEIGGSVLSISQFTLYANTKKGGRRPSYSDALNGEEAKKLYDMWNQKLSELNIHVEMGVFGADMKVSLINDGPVTILLEKEGDVHE